MATNETETTQAPAPESSAPSSSKMEQALEIVRSKRLWAAGLSLVPVPLLDVAAISAVQLKMIQEISEVYGATLTDNLGKNIIATLIGGVGTVGAANTVGYMVNKLPAVGPLLGIATLPALAATTTHAIGVVFANAFEHKDPSMLNSNAVAQLMGSAA